MVYPPGFLIYFLSRWAEFLTVLENQYISILSQGVKFFTKLAMESSRILAISCTWFVSACQQLGNFHMRY